MMESRRERSFDTRQRSQKKVLDLANIQADLYGRNQSFGGTFTVTDFNSEGTKNATRLEVFEDNVIHFDPGIDSVISERIPRKITKRKPKIRRILKMEKSEGGMSSLIREGRTRVMKETVKMRGRVVCGIRCSIGRFIHVEAKI